MHVSDSSLWRKLNSLLYEVCCRFNIRVTHERPKQRFGTDLPHTLRDQGKVGGFNAFKLRLKLVCRVIFVFDRRSVSKGSNYRHSLPNIRRGAWDTSLRPFPLQTSGRSASSQCKYSHWKRVRIFFFFFQDSI